MAVELTKIKPTPDIENGVVGVENTAFDMDPPEEASTLQQVSTNVSP